MCLLILLGEKGLILEQSKVGPFFPGTQYGDLPMSHSFSAIIFNKFPRRLTKN